MNAELKQKWIAALRSGDYQQGKDYLFHQGRHCCLGVLCEVAGVKRGPDNRYDFGDGFYSGKMLFGKLLDEITRVGDVAPEKLAELNDEGESFASIAARIAEDIPEG